MKVSRIINIVAIVPALNPKIMIKLIFEANFFGNYFYKQKRMGLGKQS